MGNDHMSDIDPTAPISEQAAHWCVLFRGGNATRADKKAFSEWVSRSPERVAAYIQAACLTTALKSSQVHWPDTPVETLVREARATPAEIVPLFPTAVPPARRSGRGPWIWAIAATLLGVVGYTWLALTGPQRYSTAVGEQRSIVLGEGSVVTLNTSSNIEVRFGTTRRTIQLLAGEALFQVAHDPVRPFEVVAGSTTVRAVGTQFNVDRRASSTTITVLEGKVSVADAPEDSHDKTPDRDTPIPLSAGEEVVLSPRVRPHTTAVNVTLATAWTQRRLIFERRPLGEVAAEFNRYNRREIHIEGARLRAQEVTGMVQANDPSSLLDFIAKIPNVRIEQHADSIRVIAAGD